MSSSAWLLPPSSSLPPLRTIPSLAKHQIFSALQELTTLYCPLASPDFKIVPKNDVRSGAAKSGITDTRAAVHDSGYASGIEEDGDDVRAAETRKRLPTLRADTFERAFVEKWLTSFIARVEEMECFDSEETRQRAVDQASDILESFYANVADEEECTEDADFLREFVFSLSLPVLKSQEQHTIPIKVLVNDGLAGTKDSEDFDDVGLQTWGASVILSELMSANPSRFGLVQPVLGPSPKIVELGAGTGLLSLVLAGMLPHLGAPNASVLATDYHEAVLANLRRNVEANVSKLDNDITPQSIAVRALDWSAPSTEPPFDSGVDVLVAADVIYGADHAVWLRDCATKILLPGGTFWLLMTVRHTGRLAGVRDTVRWAFSDEERPRNADGRRLCIKSVEDIAKKKGVGRGDEDRYVLFNIGWE
jgi:hypothetical protein